MVDLIPNLTAEMTFLEPSCGTGNFLVEILQRKFDLFDSDDETAWACHVIACYGSLYGVDIMEDNVIETRQRLLDMLPEKLKGLTPLIQLTLEENIVVGDFLKATGIDVHDKKKKSPTKEEIQEGLTKLFKKQTTNEY